MIKNLPLKDSIKYLRCPFDKQKLKALLKKIKCTSCLREFEQSKNIIEFVIPDGLDNRTKKELKGNEYSLDKETVKTFASKDKWSSYHRYVSDKKFNLLIKKLNSIPLKGLVSLGTGTGFEIKKILTRKKIKLIFASDLSYTAMLIVPPSLKKFDIDLCMFTSDMNYPPVIPDDELPILVYEAMHHTGDIHNTMKRLMSLGYKNILFVEPTTNFIINFLAKFGLAERVEYSGSKPSLLSIKKLRKICEKYNYDLDIDIVWEFPEDFYRKVFGNNKTVEKIFLKFADFLSWIGNFNKIGYMSIGHLKKK